MAVTINAKGTSSQSFMIGKRGTTLFQGTEDPSLTLSVKEGDFWFDTLTGTLMFRESAAWSTSDSTEKYNVIPGDSSLTVNSRYFVPTNAILTLPNVENTQPGDCITLSADFTNPPTLQAFGAQLIVISSTSSVNSLVLDHDQEINVVSDGIKWTLLADQVISGGTF